MSAHQILNLILISLVLFVLAAPGAYLLFRKAGVPGWKGLIPVYNTYIMLQLAHRRLYWVLLQLIPVVGWFITLGIYIDRHAGILRGCRGEQYPLGAKTRGKRGILLVGAGDDLTIRQFCRRSYFKMRIGRMRILRDLPRHLEQDGVLRRKFIRAVKYFIQECIFLFLHWSGLFDLLEQAFPAYPLIPAHPDQPGFPHHMILRHEAPVT